MLFANYCILKMEKISDFLTDSTSTQNPDDFSRSSILFFFYLFFSIVVFTVAKKGSVKLKLILVILKFPLTGWKFTQVLDYVWRVLRQYNISVHLSSLYTLLWSMYSLLSVILAYIIKFMSFFYLFLILLYLGTVFYIF